MFVTCSHLLRHFLFDYSKEWSEEESEEEDSQQPISREDSGIQLDRTPQEDKDNTNKTVPVTWTGMNPSHVTNKYKH